MAIDWQQGQGADEDPHNAPSGELSIPMSAAMRAWLQRAHRSGLYGDTLEDTARQMLAEHLRGIRDRLADEL